MSKIVVTYKCEKCGRIKTVRFNTNPTPYSYGNCPRCKNGMLYSVIRRKENND